MYINSQRIAPLGLYTNRTDIPRYQTYGNRTALNFAHVIDSAREPRGGAEVAQVADDIFAFNDPLPQILEEQNEESRDDENNE